MNVIQIWLFDLRHECVLGLEYYHTPGRCFQNAILITGLTLYEISHSLPPNTHTRKKHSHNNDFADCSPNNNQICPHWQMRFGIFLPWFLWIWASIFECLSNGAHFSAHCTNVHSIYIWKCFYDILLFSTIRFIFICYKRLISRKTLEFVKTTNDCSIFIVFCCLLDTNRPKLILESPVARWLLFFTAFWLLKWFQYLISFWS